MARDPKSGRYAFDGNFERMCKCGHALGLHLHGGHDCLETPCDCKKFRPTLSQHKRGGAAKAPDTGEDE